MFLAAPSSIPRAVAGLVASTDFLKSFWITTLELLTAYGLSVVIGIGLGLILGWTKYLRSVLSPYILAIYSIPKMVLFPLFLLGFGVSFNANMWFGFFHGFFPIVINTIAGVRDVNPLLINAAKSMGASTWQTFRKAVIPQIVPTVMTGLRLGMGSTFIGVLVAEMFAVSEHAGLGYLLTLTAAQFQTPKMYAVILLISAVTILSNQTLLIFERRASRWRV